MLDTETASKYKVCALITHLHQTAIVKESIKLILDNRQVFRTVAELEEISGNGGSRINDYLKAILKRFENEYNAMGTVDEHLKVKSKSRSSTSSRSPKKSQQNTPKKRKTSDFDEKEEIDWVDVVDEEQRIES